VIVDETLREELIQKLTAMRKLGEDVRKTAGLACIEGSMRFVDINCVSALWNLGALDYWEYEVEQDER